MVSVSPAQDVRADVGAAQDLGEDVAENAAVDASGKAVDAGGDDEVNALFADGVRDDGDDDGPPLSPRPSEEDGNWPEYISNAGPSVLALREQIPLLRAELVSFLDELDNFARQLPSNRRIRADKRTKSDKRA